MPQTHFHSVARLAYLLEHFLASSPTLNRQLAWIPPLYYFLYRKNQFLNASFPSLKQFAALFSPFDFKTKGRNTEKTWQALRMRLWIELSARNNQLSIEVADCPGHMSYLFFSLVRLYVSVTAYKYACASSSHLMSSYCIHRRFILSFWIFLHCRSSFTQHRQKEAHRMRNTSFKLIRCTSSCLSPCLYSNSCYA